MTGRYSTLETAAGDVLELDEVYMVDWVQWGLSEMGQYLEMQARFAEYCHYRESYLATGALWLTYPEDNFYSGGTLYHGRVYDYEQEDAA